MVMQRPDVVMALNWLDAGEAPLAGGIQRGRAAGPLGKIGVVVQHTSCGAS